MAFEHDSEASPNAQQTSNTQENGEDESQYPSGLNVLILTIGLCLGMLVVALDNTVIATAIPRITTEFHSLGDTGWYGSAYLLTNCALQPTFGKVYTVFNVKWTYITALLIFELGSILCAAAKSSTMLIVGRAVAGAGAAALFSGAMNIIGSSVPLRKRPVYIGILGSMFGIASVVGPLIGGALTEYVTWRWCFCLPIGGLTVATVVIFFSSPAKQTPKQSLVQKLRGLDAAGAVLLISAIICLLLALQWGGTTYSWSDSKVFGCLIGFGLLLIAFSVLQVYLGDHGTLPPRILKQRTVWSVCWFEFVLGLGLYTLIYYLPFYFQAVRFTSAESSGIRMIPLLVSITIASIVGGSVTTITGHYVAFLWLSGGLFTIAAGLCYTLETNSYAGKWIGYQLLAGIGCGLSLQVPFVATQVVLPPADQPIGNSLVVFFTSLGGALAVSIANSIFSNALLQELNSRISDSALVAAIIQAGATGIKATTPSNLVQDVSESYNYAITRAFILAIAAGGIAFIFSLFTEWKHIDIKKPSPEESKDVSSDGRDAPLEESV
ncbi:conserved hypothetical protein [Talaromyces marneffei ATCC 18224]|uniref:Major facilitator superfamily (MFS) profile domain-containing protein n=1 Tax=Talaromyces marneffei (strain ATCC 18224 / CBS 334.59 / QM 7333) TaxID=441960 RepID=B6QRQ4_TALMQ|nr:conserved hypothetical protein [Talaromyces marneffei ATCC 18224]